MLKTNIERVPEILVEGSISHSVFDRHGKMGIEGEVHFLVGTGGITFNALIGDNAVGWDADHLEPGVSTKNNQEKFNDAYFTYSCIGNGAIVKTGDAKGAKGFVTGKHGYIDHVILHFSDEDMRKMSIGDKIQVNARGQGLRLIDYPNIILRNMSEALLHKMNIFEEESGIRVGVAKIVPACIMGSGIGDPAVDGDYDISLFDESLVKRYGLDQLRFGDIVAIQDADTRYGRCYRTGAISIGVIVHSDSKIGGHGPGFTTLMSSKNSVLQHFIDEEANLVNMFTV